MRNPNRVLDKTFLSANNADERVIRHRDLISHAFRWANVARHLAKNGKYQTAVVLDVGCGKEMPLARMLYSNRLLPLKYVGVDANRFDVPDMLKGKKMPITIWAETDFCALEPEDVGFKILDKSDPEGPKYDDYLQPNVVTCFEVLEHVTPEHARRMLQHMLTLTSPNCDFFISTPCWDGHNAAENHINEMRVDALGALFEDLGFEVTGLWGTFASQRDYKPVMELRYPGISQVYEKLSEYYDSTIISVMFAPLFPMESRNCLWHLTKKTGDAAAQDRLFAALDQLQGPWSQHPAWVDLAGEVHA